MILRFKQLAGGYTYINKKTIIYFEESSDDSNRKYTYIYTKGGVSSKVIDTAEEIMTLMNNKTIQIPLNTLDTFSVIDKGTSGIDAVQQGKYIDYIWRREPSSSEHTEQVWVNNQSPLKK